MMKRFATKTIYTTALGLLLAPAALAASSIDQGIQDANPGAGNVPQHLDTPTGAFHTIADTLIYVIGAIAVIMLIIGGLRYVISQGDAAGVKQAKDTILYAVIGIVVAILAYAIVNFVSGAISASS
jgi:hypothetical protein